VFNILSDDCVLLLEDMVGANNPIQRLVDEYVKKENGQYVLVGVVGVLCSYGGCPNLCMLLV